MLALLSAERSPAFPDVPTFRELGINGLQVDTWYAVFAPAGTPVAVINRINADINALLRQPEIIEQLAKQGMAPVGGPPSRMVELLRLELSRWSRVVKAANIQAE
jgi:tripartite-type tricarboxylate transporter receptor subunit TctC